MALKIEVAKGSGFCFGVKRAISMAEKASYQFAFKSRTRRQGATLRLRGIRATSEARASPKGEGLLLVSHKEERRRQRSYTNEGELVSKERNVFTLGPLIHNKEVVESLKQKGVGIVEKIEDIKSGVVIFRSHGAMPEDYIKAQDRGLTIVDGTCPIVAKVQQIAKDLKNEGYCVVVFGEKEHPEVKGIVGYARNAIVISNKNDARKIREKKIGLVSQTTQSLSSFNDIIGELLKNAHCLKVYNTICKAVLKLQKSSLSLAKRSDLFLVIGGKNSANTKRLFLLTKGINPNTHHIENASSIKRKWLKGEEKIGLTGGTSTPPWVIKEVVERLRVLSVEF